LPKGPPGSLLDIGCGNGEFLMYAKALGWNVEGIDFDAKAIVSAKKNGINARLGGVELYSGESELFDVISLAHVIEHVHDPIELLKSSFKLLKKEGVFWIETPNINSIGSRMFGENWRGLEPPRHLCLFNHENLKSTLLSVGFSTVEVAEYRPLFKNIYFASINLMFKHVSFFKKKYFEFCKIKKVEADCKSNYKNREYITYVCKK
jgi:SAM-dependent methyltransferase